LMEENHPIYKNLGGSKGRHARRTDAKESTLEKEVSVERRDARNYAGNIEGRLDSCVVYRCNIDTPEKRTLGVFQGMAEVQCLRSERKELKKN